MISARLRFSRKNREVALKVRKYSLEREFDYGDGRPGFHFIV